MNFADGAGATVGSMFILSVFSTLRLCNVIQFQGAPGAPHVLLQATQSPNSYQTQLKLPSYNCSPQITCGDPQTPQSQILHLTDATAEASRRRYTSSAPITASVATIVTSSIFNLSRNARVIRIAIVARNRALARTRTLAGAHG